MTTRNPLISLIFILVVISCQKKAVPTITERNAVPPSKVSYTYPPESAAPADTLTGRQLFTARCGRCHGLPEPQQFTITKWENILPIMFPRTGLSSEQAFHVRAYLLANAGSK
jgi:cytochrome c5